MMLVHLFVVAWFFSSAFSMECDGPQWKEYLGNCYLFDNTYRTAGNCKTHCDSFGANLLCIEDANREKYILENLSSGNSVWLDFHENPNGGGFTWGDTCANTGYSDWDSIPGENALQSCGVLTKNGHWLATECDKGYFVTCSCEKPAIKAPSDETCPDGWGVDGSECYLVNVKKDPMSWQECENYCSAKNAHMPCVEDAEKDEYLVNHMRTFPKMWLSYNSIASGNEWVWAPQCSSTGYTHFDPTPPYGSTGDCAVLPRDNPDGWLQESCGAISIDPKYCVCQASASSLAVNPPPDNDDFSNDDNSTSRPKSFVTEYFPLMFGLFGGVILLVIIGSFVSPHLSKQSGTPLPVHYQHVGSTATPTTVVVSVSASSSAPEALGVTTAEAYPTAPAARAIDTASHTGGSYAGSSVGMVPLSYSSTPAAHPQHSFSTEQNGSNGGGSGLGWSWFRQAPRNIDRW